MKDFIISYGATILVSVIVAAALIFAIKKIIKDKKRGKSCLGGCDSCIFKDNCHK